MPFGRRTGIERVHARARRRSDRSEAGANRGGRRGGSAPVVAQGAAVSSAGVVRNRWSRDRASPHSDCLRAKRRLARRDISGSRTGPPPRLWLWPSGVGISARGSVLADAGIGRRDDGVLPDFWRRTGLLPAGRDG